MSNGLAIGQPEPQDMSDRKIEQEEGGQSSKRRVKVREKKTQNRFFHQLACEANTSPQTKTYTPAMECKYLDLVRLDVT